MTGREAENTTCLHKVYTGKYDLLDLLEHSPEIYPFFLETTADADGADTGYDILFAFPQQKIIKHADSTVSVNGTRKTSSRFLDELDHAWAQHTPQTDIVSNLPFRGGWFVYLGYELVNEIEPSIEPAISQYDLPLALAVRIPAAIIFEHATNQTHLWVESGYSELLEQLESDLANIHPEPDRFISDLVEEIQEEQPNNYIDSVQKIHDYIRDGDVFQVNLSREWKARLNPNVTDTHVYRRLKESNPAPFSAIMKTDKFSVISSSPERLVRQLGNHVETRPIAGTRPRGRNISKDTEMKDELVSNDKERAEHVMLIDLERNDLGRICIPGTIEVDEFMVLESYAHVHHIVSNISGQLNTDVTPGKVISAVFPGGTITGCPKVRCMEIIQELENTTRGAYTGSLGYLNHNGDMDLNILIRTITIHDNLVSFRAGAGIVADSVAEREVMETQAKAQGLILALKEECGD